MSDNKNPILRALDKAINALSGQGPQNSAPNIAPSDGAISRRNSIYQGARDRVDDTPLGPEGISELNPRILKRPSAHALALDNVYVTPEQSVIFNHRLVEDGWFDGVPSSLRESIVPKQERWIRVQEAVAKSMVSPMKAHTIHQADVAERIAAGGPHDAKDSWTIIDFEQDQQERVKALKGKAREIENEAWALVEPELLRKADAFDAMADDVEVRERDHAESWGFTCLAPWVLALRRMAQNLRDGSRRGMGAPLAMLEGI